jgi:hypothetical protein
MPSARRSRYNSLRRAISFIWLVTDVTLVTRKLIAASTARRSCWVSGINGTENRVIALGSSEEEELMMS